MPISPRNFFSDAIDDRCGENIAMMEANVSYSFMYRVDPAGVGPFGDPGNFRFDSHTLLRRSAAILSILICSSLSSNDIMLSIFPLQALKLFKLIELEVSFAKDSKCRLCDKADHVGT